MGKIFRHLFNQKKVTCFKCEKVDKACNMRKFELSHIGYGYLCMDCICKISPFLCKY